MNPQEYLAALDSIETAYDQAKIEARAVIFKARMSGQKYWRADLNRRYKDLSAARHAAIAALRARARRCIGPRLP